MVTSKWTQLRNDIQSVNFSIFSGERLSAYKFQNVTNVKLRRSFITQEQFFNLEHLLVLFQSTLKWHLGSLSKYDFFENRTYKFSQKV